MLEFVLVITIFVNLFITASLIRSNRKAAELNADLRRVIMEASSYVASDS